MTSSNLEKVGELIAKMTVLFLMLLPPTYLVFVGVFGLSRYHQILRESLKSEERGDE